MKDKHALLICLLVSVFVILGCKPTLRKFNDENCFIGYAENVRCLHGIVFWDVFAGTGYIPAEFISLIEEINPDKGAPVDPRPGYVIYAYQITEFPDEESYLQIILESPINMAEIWIEGSLKSESNPLMYGGYANIIKVNDIRPLNADEYEELYRKYAKKAE
jgi:hypothetical protein